MTASSIRIPIILRLTKIIISLIHNRIKSSVIFASFFILGGCDLMNDRLANVGRLPELSKVNFYENQGNINPLNGYVDARSASGKHIYKEPVKQPKTKNSMWSQNSQSFFETYKVGDLISVIISVQDKALINNQTQKSRSSDSSLGVPNFFGMEKNIKKYDSGSMISANGGANSTGNGKINRSEVIETTVAATIVDILPSGNLYIRGSQEIRINYEVRQVTIEGIVRHNDIDSNNSVQIDKIAEARISYGGRGQISEYQQPPYGNQIIDAISPF